ncbi:type II toxin-antitoxin system RelE/ParE family toxin [Perlucidibaca aquatica]|uniref:type II toxin-antitoxin system RelE/ParE family toxin n=1 Tax=Perlucidibaca aquatica TaxID=1852776 RepID=UPI000ACBC3BF|nr:type II toxin-antitoxin system RelE/ParE family toxin [Perlucidibaca aquatica]
MQRIRWTDEASTDLVEIIDYIEQRNPLAATDLHQEIVQAVEGLPSGPFLFRAGRVPGTRECIVHPNYLIVYRIGVETIDVIRVLHARQAFPINS